MNFINLQYAFSDHKETNVQDILNKNLEKKSSSESSTNISLNLNVTEVTKNLYLGSALSVHSSTLQLLGVNCVLNATSELPDTPLPNEDVRYYRICIYDNPNENIKQHFDTCSQLIQEVATSGGKTMLHCTAGVSRSSTLCIAYLMKFHELSLLDAYDYLKLRRPIIKPNCGFFKQLIDYEFELYGNNTVKLVYHDLLNLELPDVYASEYKSLSYFRKKCKNSPEETVKRLP